jgi:iron(III) transport system permease protein
MRSLRREPALLLALLAVAALVLAFIVYPQLNVVLTPGPGGYVQFLQEGTWLVPLRNSVELTLLSTTTAVLLGFVYAYAMVYSNMRWKPFFRLVGILPLLSPPFVVAAAYTLLFGARGIVSYGVFGQSPNIYGLMGVWGVQTIAFFPFAYQLMPMPCREAIRAWNRPRAISVRDPGGCSGPSRCRSHARASARRS